MATEVHKGIVGVGAQGGAVVEAAEVVDGEGAVAAGEEFLQAAVAVVAEPAAGLLFDAWIVGRQRCGVLLCRGYARVYYQIYYEQCPFHDAGANIHFFSDMFFFFRIFAA